MSTGSPNARLVDVLDAARSPEVRFSDRYPSGVLHTEIVIDGAIEFLLAAQVALGRLNRCVAEQELYLLQLSTEPNGTTGRRYGASNRAGQDS